LSFNAQVKALAPFAERFAFFTPAIPYLWGRFADALLFHFLELQGCRVDFFHTKFDRPLFQGMTAPDGDADWNYVLWAVERQHWQAFEDYVLAAVVADTPRKTVVRYGSQDLMLVDPLAASRQIVVTTAFLCPVTVFGVRSNKATVAVKEVPGTLPQVVWHAPDKQCILYAGAIFEQQTTEPLRGGTIP
jgi:hypothetical protein